jgi:glycogen debranching enzyme
MLRVVNALFDASLYMDLRRMPELFCGFERRQDEGPTAYPVACTPQAWSGDRPSCCCRRASDSASRR